MNANGVQTDCAIRGTAVGNELNREVMVTFKISRPVRRAIPRGANPAARRLTR